MDKGYKVAVNIPDCHIPWHSKAAFTILINVMKDLDKSHGIDQVNIMGDFLDFFHVGLHPKMPSHFSVKQTFQDEIYMAHKALDLLDKAAPEARIRYLEGNHEFRLARYLTAKCPELFDMVKVPELLDLDRRGIEFVPYGKKQLVQCLDTEYRLRHVPYNQGKHTAMGTIDAKKISLGYGHTHRKQLVTCTDALGRELVGRSLGWLGDRSAAVFDYMDFDNWSMGFEYVISLKGEAIKTYIDIQQVDNDLVAFHNGYFYIEPVSDTYDGYIL